ncbi:hypothetical protein [Stenotrophobium rhamnosiphilum]|uniref:DUF4124 domain-containing protein n=1 Tax=Stenotrophobium rhamnosiphilum TaxID=2029166 RepID=A0A2T5MB44_9GAMM|nr:hypothetical protein [Stenotrophobium rhamnosiphilum]PTU28221.1 hypothetical protein CJD38_17885 [Stenotrophobium rhamnosiphilum]
MRKAFSASLFLLMALPLVASAAPGGKKIQCWTDNKGNRSCGDSIPPQYADKEREIFNNQGMVVDKRARQLTPEEVTALETKKAEEAAAAKKATEQLAYDKFLTDTYSSSKELESARILREQTLDGRLVLVKKAIADSEKTVADLRGRVAAQAKPGKKPDKRVEVQLKKFEASLEDNKKSAVQLQQEREKMVAKFNSDIERYKFLRPGH